MIGFERPAERFGYVRAKNNSSNHKSKSFYSYIHFAVYGVCVVAVVVIVVVLWGMKYTEPER